jgi:hypothetical protein
LTSGENCPDCDPNQCKSQPQRRARAKYSPCSLPDPGRQDGYVAVVVDHVVGGGQALGARCLRGEDALDFLAGEAVADHDAGNLGFLAAVDHGHAFTRSR